MNFSKHDAIFSETNAGNKMFNIIWLQLFIFY
jgi:hypothetical protein